jgi:60S ribosome subunit biogenesis protein NIP7
LKSATHIARDNLISLGVCFGKFTKSGKFTLHVTCLEHLSQFAKYKIWIKPTSKMPYLYGNHVLKAHLAKMTEDTPQHQGVIVCSSSDIPLGFAVTGRSTLECRNLDPTAIIAFHQTDLGEYLHDEDTLF